MSRQQRDMGNSYIAQYQGKLQVSQFPKCQHLSGPAFVNSFCLDSLINGHMRRVTGSSVDNHSDKPFR
jgi:hypothetical protein